MDQEQSYQETFDAILVATGKTPNVENLNCEIAGVKYDDKGVQVNQSLQTTNPSIYAGGDCIPGPNFTHNSDIQSRLILNQALLLGTQLPKTIGDINLPYCTYTDPEIA